MIRNNIVPRRDWEDKVSELGLIWHTADGEPYWNESAYYQFTRRQITEIEKASVDVYELLLEAGDYVIKSKQLGRFGIPSYAHSAIESSWFNEPPALNYGRFDFGYDGVSPPKLFEFNCDTPTSLLEASAIQWYWKEEVFPLADQYNSIHESLVERWRELGPRLRQHTDGIIHFSHIDDEAGEDTITTTYMRDIAQEAGLKTQGVLIPDIGWNGNHFVDAFDVRIRVCQHLYPWEWIVNEEFGKHVVNTLDQTLWIEPVWKMMWSNKAILAMLSFIAPEHPNLLKTSMSEPDMTQRFVKKPILAREGANIEIYDGETITRSIDQEYGAEGYVYQELYNLPEFDGRYPVIGAWMVDGAPIGMGIREDGLITGNTAKFVPHIVL